MSRAEGSYQKINYLLRPAKSIERKMLTDAFRRLSPFGAVAKYRYVGFGSTYFGDFVRVHRALGISNMVSIERDVHNASRFEFNRPFRCIELRFEESNVALPQLPWDARTIVWLDYDGKLTANVLEDIQTVMGSALPGSVLIVSVNAMPSRCPDGLTPSKLPTWRVEQLTEQVGDKHVPLGLDGRSLAGWGTADVYRRIINDSINATLNDRNGGRAPGTSIRYRQLFNFHYSDNARMLTVGGIVYDEGQATTLAACAFDDLPFVRDGAASYEILVPNLTLREIQYLDSRLPMASEEAVSLSAVPQEDLDAYANVYRYFPAFAKTDI